MEKLLSYAPSLMLMFIGLVMVSLFGDQPGLTVSLSNFGLGSGEVGGGGEDISIGWFAVLASITMYIITWWKERKAPQPEIVRSRGLGPDAETTALFTAKFKRAAIYALVGLALLSFFILLGSLL